LFSMIVLGLTAFVVFRFETLAGSAWNLAGSGSGPSVSIAADHKIGYEDATSFHLEDGYVLKCGDQALRLYNTSAQPVWEKALHGQNVEVDGNEKTIAVADPTAGDIFLLDKTGQIKAKKFGLGAISNIMHPSENYLVCRMIDKNELRIFDGNLESIARIPMPDGEVLDIDVSSSESLIAISMFRLENETYHSQILTYQMDGQPIGAINLKGKIILDIAAIDDKMIGVTDEQAFSYNIKNELLWEVDLDRVIKKATVSEDGMILLNLVKSGEDLTDPRPDNVIKYIDADGQSISEVAIEYDIEEMKRANGQTAFSTVDRLYILSEAGKMESILDTGGNLRHFNFIGRKFLGVEFGDRLDILKMD